MCVYECMRTHIYIWDREEKDWLNDWFLILKACTHTWERERERERLREREREREKSYTCIYVKCSDPI